MGLANFCFPGENFDRELDKLIEEILENSWFSHRANKKLMADTDGLPLTAGLAHEIYKGEGRGPDVEKRISAFTAKTKK
jgi:1,4-dihydroxy-2-naphthoyl-CoA synthase